MTEPDKDPLAVFRAMLDPSPAEQAEWNVAELERCVAGVLDELNEIWASGDGR